MKLLLDAFWRAAAYCLHPRVMAWSLLPLAVVAAAALALNWLYWHDAVAWMREGLATWWLPNLLFGWLETLGAGDLRAVMAPLVIVALTLPGVIVVTLVLVALTVTPVVVRMVASRRFPALARRASGAGWFAGLAWSLLWTLGALLALVLSVPLWFVPPLVLVVPPLIWGWLAYKVFSFDALALHAGADERREVLRTHRLPMLAMGVVSGYLGAAPALVWAFGIATLVLAPVLIVVSVWLYTLVFAFSAAWFAHYALAALQARRDEVVAAAAVVEVLDRPAPAPTPAKLPHQGDDA